MSINLPHWLAEVIGVLGFSWPEIDEDQLHEAATVLRHYASDAEHSANATGQRITDLSSAYQGQSYAALVNVWSHQSHSHMETLVQGCQLLAGGLDLAAEGVVAMKMKCIAQLGIAAAEVAADQGAAILTFGLAEAGLPFIIAAQNRILNGILNMFVSEVVGELLDKTLGPVREMVDHAVDKLLYAELAGAVSAGAGDTLLMDAPTLRAHADAMLKEAEGNSTAGKALHNRLSSLTFSTAG